MAKEKVELKPERLVQVMNVTPGKLIYKNPRTSEKIIFTEPEQIQDMTVAELKTMKASAPKYLNEPWVYVMDEEVVEYLGLTQLYEKLKTPSDLDKFFKASERDITNYLKTCPNGVKEVIAKKTIELVRSGDITIKKQRAIEEALGIKIES